MVNHFGASNKEMGHNNFERKKERMKKRIDDLCLECVHYKGINPVSGNRMCNREGLFYVVREDSGVRKVKDCCCFYRKKRRRGGKKYEV